MLISDYFPKHYPAYKYGFNHNIVLNSSRIISLKVLNLNYSLTIRSNNGNSTCVRCLGAR